MASRFCKNHPDCFCDICGECKTVDNRKSITDFVQKAYYAYFEIKLGDQKKPWAPHVVCKISFETMDKWNQTVNEIWYTNGFEGAYKSC